MRLRFDGALLFLCMLTTVVACGARAESASHKPVQAEEGKGTEVRIECTVRIYKKSNSVWADIRFTNAGSKSVAVWRRNLILDGKPTWEAFEITRDGSSVPYRGLMIKRAEPKASEYLEMKTGDKIRTEINLSKYYDLSKHGNYTVQYSALNPNPETREILLLTSPSVSFPIPLKD